jgi:hypothetical protein
MTDETLTQKIRLMNGWLASLNRMQAASQEISVELIKDSLSEPEEEMLAAQSIALLFSQLTLAIAGANVAFSRAILAVGVPMAGVEMHSALASVEEK